MELIKIYFQYVKDPSSALKALLEKRSSLWACSGYFAATLGWVLFFNIGDSVIVPVLLLKLLVVFLAELTAGYFIASLCGLYLDFCRVKSSPAELFVLIGSAGFIKGLLIAFALISAALPWAKLGFLAVFALVFVFALQLGYLTRALTRVYDLRIGRALGAWLFGFVPVISVGVLLVAFLIWGIALLA